VADAARDEIGDVRGASTIEPPSDRRLVHRSDVDSHARADSPTCHVLLGAELLETENVRAQIVRVTANRDGAIDAAPGW
jgi:hypothetical protein